MALSKFTPAQSVANQIRTKSLGVKTGGAQGRSNQVHKGVGLNRNSGGLNARGSGQKVTGTFAASSPGVGAVRPGTAAPTWKPGTKPTTWTDKQGNLRAIGGRIIRPAAAKPATFTPPALDAPTKTAADPAVVGKPTGPLEYRGLSSYMGGMADLNLQLSQDRAGLKRQLDDLKPQYDRAQVEAKRGYSRAIEDSEDDMNRAGLLRSGKREVVDADRFREFNDHIADVEKNLGAGAAAQITEALARLDEYEAQQRLALEAQAREQYDELYPAAPLDVSAPVSAPEPGAGGGGGGGSVPAGNGPGVSTVPAGTPAPQSPWLRVYVPNGKGGYKIGNQARNTMSPAELKAALASPLNRGR